MHTHAENVDVLYYTVTVPHRIKVHYKGYFIGEFFSNIHVIVHYLYIVQSMIVHIHVLIFSAYFPPSINLGVGKKFS